MKKFNLLEKVKLEILKLHKLKHPNLAPFVSAFEDCENIYLKFKSNNIPCLHVVE